MPRDAVVMTVAGASGLKRGGLLPLLAAAALALAGCARTVNDYLREARSNSPGAVKDAVIAIGELLHRKEATGIPFDAADREAMLYLKDVAGSNPVPTNRAVALRALGQLQGADAADVIRGGLKDPFWLARLEAVQTIELHPDPSFAEPLRELYSNETRAEVRLEVVKALRQVKGPVALRTLLEVFFKRSERSRDPQVHAYSGIREMTGLSYGFYDLTGWKEYYQGKYGALPSDESMPAESVPGGPAAGPPASPNPIRDAERKAAPADKAGR